MRAGQPGSLPPEIFGFLRRCLFLSLELSGSLSAVCYRPLDCETTCFYCVAFRLHSPPNSPTSSCVPFPFDWKGPARFLLEARTLSTALPGDGPRLPADWVNC